jgi:hypothetical protein
MLSSENHAYIFLQVIYLKSEYARPSDKNDASVKLQGSSWSTSTGVPGTWINFYPVFLRTYPVCLLFYSISKVISKSTFDCLEGR